MCDETSGERAASRQPPGVGANHGPGVYWKRFFVLALYLFPLAWLSIIAGVAIHEIAGHGFAAWLVGGTFTGFVVQWDGMGWAWSAAAPGAPLWHEVVIFAAGMVSTLVAGVVLLVWARRVRDRFFLRMLLLLLAVMTLLEAGPYLLWNAYRPVGSGDVAVLLSLLDVPGLRGIFLAAGAVLTVGATVLLNALIFQGVEQWLGQGRRLEGWRRVAALAGFIAIPGTLSWWSFDWNQLIDGIGRLPNVVGTALELATAGGLYWCSFTVRAPVPPLADARWPIVAAWGATGLLLLAMWAWLSEGVFWG